jgi:hypothetical protein
VVSRYLQALENEEIKKLPGGTYNRAYLRMYADYLRLDAGELLRQYDLVVQAQSQSSAEGSDAVSVMRAAAQRRAPRRGRERRVVARAAAAVALAAVVAALGLSLRPEWFTPAYWSGGRPDMNTIGRSVRRFAEPPLHAEPIAATLRVAPLAPPGIVSASSSPAPSSPAVVAHSPDQPDSGALSGLSVPRAGVGTDVVERHLVGESDTFQTGSTVVFWTFVEGGHAGDVVRHVWIHDGLTIRIVELAVGSPQWRTYSRMPLDAASAGEWVVEARDRDGRVLARRTFHAPS